MVTSGMLCRGRNGPVSMARCSGSWRRVAGEFGNGGEG